MKNLRYLITVLALFNLSVIGAASAVGTAAPQPAPSSSGTTSTMAIHTGNE